MLRPALCLDRLQRLESILFVTDLFELIPCQIWRDRFDNSFFLGVLIPNLRAFLELPSRTCLKTNGTKQSGWIFDKSVRTYQPQRACLEVGNAVQRVEEQSIGALVQRHGHGIRRKVSAAQVF